MNEHIPNAEKGSRLVIVSKGTTREPDIVAPFYKPNTSLIVKNELFTGKFPNVDVTIAEQNAAKQMTRTMVENMSNLLQRQLWVDV